VCVCVCVYTCVWLSMVESGMKISD
jgi:hypothetical protein